VQEVANTLDLEEGELYESLLEQQEILPKVKFSLDMEDVKARMTQQKVYMSLFMRHIKGTQPENVINISSRVMQEFHGQMPLFKQELERWEHAGFSVLIMAINEKRAEKIQSILNDYGMEIAIQND